MSKRKLEATTTQLDKLLADVSVEPVRPFSEHLTDDAAIGYTMEALSDSEMQWVEVHLSACPNCVTEVEQLVMATHFWNSTPGKARLDSLRKRIRYEVLKQQPQQPVSRDVELINSRIADWFRLFSVAIPEATTTTLLVRAKTEDDKLRWNIEEDEDHNLTIRFGSHALELEGIRLRLSAGDWRDEQTLKRRDPKDNQVGAKFFISRAERKQMKVETTLQVALSNDTPELGPDL